MSDRGSGRNNGQASQSFVERLYQSRYSIEEGSRAIQQIGAGDEHRTARRVNGRQDACDRRRLPLHVRLRDLLWDALYAPLARFVDYGAGALNRVQFLTIRAYLSLVFSALVLLLMVLAIWQ